MGAGRKPVSELAKLDYPPTRDGIWKLIRENRDSFTIRVLLDCKAHRKTVTDYIKCLIKAGIVEEIDPIEKAKAYRLIKDYGAEAPRVRVDGSIILNVSAVNNMWRTIRMQNAPFTYKDLALFAATDDCPIADNTAKTYLGFIQHLPCIRVLPHKKGLPGLAKYAFVRSKDIGPKAPQIQKTKRLFDPNTKKVVWEDVKEVKL